MLDFIIVTPVYRRSSAGVVVLHELAKRICDEGFQARVLLHHGGVFFSSDIDGHYLDAARTRLRSTETIDETCLTNTIFVFPETIPNNSINAKKVVHYFLFYDGYHIGQHVDIQRGSFIACYSASFYFRSDMILFLPVLPNLPETHDIDSFSNRRLDVTYIDDRKNTHKRKPYFLEGTLGITKDFPRENTELQRYLGNTRYFFSWSHSNSTSSDALIAGALPIYVNAGDEYDVNDVNSISIGELAGFSVDFPWGVVDLSNKSTTVIFVPSDYHERRSKYLDVLRLAKESSQDMVRQFCNASMLHFGVPPRETEG
jgi:hypothetical protein